MNYELNTMEIFIVYFFIFDNNCIVVLFNGFQKKTQKTPLHEIEKALTIKTEYYADKQSQNN
jgi:phage-related protein